MILPTQKGPTMASSPTTLTILSLPSGCVQCNAVKRHLTKKGIPATILDARAPENMALAAQLGYASAPICIEYDEAGTIVAHWPGFNPDRMNAFIPEEPVALAA